MKQKPLLSIALLVSNRKDTIQKCLDSLTPIREAIPSELIILDTGCDADVRAILEEYADSIDDFTWIQDFSAARNVTLKHAIGEWYMYLDDDEWFVDTKEIIDFFQSGEYKDFGYANYIQRNYLDMQGSQYTDTWVSRMIRRVPNLHFESKIHEYMAPMSGNCKGLRSYVEHYGYVYETKEAMWKHYERNSVLLKEMIETEPTNLRWRIHLAQEYRTMQMWHDLYDLGTQCLALLEGKDEMYSNIYLGCFYGAWIIAMREQGLAAWRDANARGMQQTTGVLPARDTNTSKQSHAGQRGNTHGFQIVRLEKNTANATGIQKESTDVSQKSAYRTATDNSIKANRGKKPREDVQQQMHRDSTMDVCQGKKPQIVGALHEDARYYYEEGIRLCEKALKDNRNTQLFLAFCALRLTWFHYWLGHFKEAERYALEYLKWLEFFEENEPLLFLQKSAPFIADTFDEVYKKEIYSELICIGLKNNSTEYLAQYFDKLEWNQKHLYVFEDIIPVMIDAVDYIEANEQNEQIFTKVFEAIQSHHALCEYYNEEVKKAEMRKLAKQVKEQIRMLIDNGMYAQAKGVIAQVKTMLPEDAELAEMEKMCLNI